MPTNTKARTFGNGLVVDDREGEPSIFILRDPETGAGYFLTTRQALALRDALIDWGNPAERRLLRAESKLKALAASKGAA